MNRNIIIAIDGYSACGKSTTAKLVAEKLNYTYIDTGAMYRAVTYYFLEHYIALDNEKEVKRALSNIEIDFLKNAKTGKKETFLNHLNVEEEIRGMRVSEKVSEVSALSAVRNAMVTQQQQMGKKKAVVLDGRDIGTYVFPSAELKIFMTASMEIRAARRQQELLEKGELVALDDIVANIQHRDHLDTTRKENPLKQAADAKVLDTSFITVEEQVEMVLHWVMETITATVRRENLERV